MIACESARLRLIGVKRDDLAQDSARGFEVRCLGNHKALNEIPFVDYLNVVVQEHERRAEVRNVREAFADSICEMNILNLRVESVGFGFFRKLQKTHLNR